jgi:peptidoglycan/LPS O-acetylase OafA/YrhL
MTMQIQPRGGRAEYIPEFDLLRSLAIGLLFFHHGGLYNLTVFGLPLTALNHYIELFLLSSFTFLSGYLMVRSIEGTTISDFLKGRLLRIYLPYLLALVLFLLMLDIDIDETGLLVHLMGAQIVLSPALTSPILTLWYIGLILAYSVIFGILVKLFPRLPFLIAVMLGVLLLAGLARQEFSLFARRFFYYYPVFAAGLLAAKTGWLERLTSARFYLLDKLVLLAVGIFLFSPYYKLDNPDLDPLQLLAIWIYTLTAVLMALSLLRPVAQLSAAKQGPLLRVAQKVAYASFFAYLLHRPVWDIMLALTRPADPAALTAYLVGGALLLVLPLSYYGQQIYNRITHRMSKA